MTKHQKLDKKTIGRLLRITTHIGAWIPLAVLWWEFSHNQLGADPIREILLHTGTTTLVLLVLSLACTPANILFGWKQVIPLRKLLGLYAFMYVCLHFLTFIWLDYFFDLPLIIDAIAEQKYVLVGFSAFLLLIPLAATSTRWAQRRLGKNWKRLHRIVYLVAVLALIHFFWLVKNVYVEPTIYAIVVATLLFMRLRPVKSRVLRWQRRVRKKFSRRSPTFVQLLNRSRTAVPPMLEDELSN
jgi:sulfoxide reductase heme-binding subunit YedZ